ncbi:MAG: UDP-N-acetylmuramate dehydrogenase [Candidatus Margulisiibacteriota bacterium]
MKYRHFEPLSKHSSFKIGGPAQYFCEPSNSAEIREALFFAKQNKLPVAIIGSGTNLLIPDNGFRGLVIKISLKLKSIKITGTKIEVDSGMAITCLITKLAQKGLGGIEFLAGIPGSIGGAVVMNAGAWGDEIGRYVENVTVVDQRGRELIITQKELKFGYRKSLLQKQRFLVTKVTIKLFKKKPAAILSQIKEYLKIRRSKHPLNFPNCGSVFKNPKSQKNSLPAGQLIEAAGCKGIRVGNAQVSTQHANFIVNLGGATAKEVTALMKKVQATVWKRFKIKLEPEVKSMVEFFRGK